MLPNDVLPKLIFFLFTISSIFSESKSFASSTRALKLSMSLSCLHNITMHKHFQSKYKALLNHKYHTRQYFQQPGFVSLTFSPKKELKKSRILHCQSIQVLFTFYAKSNNNNDNVVRNQQIVNIFAFITSLLNDSLYQQ